MEDPHVHLLAYWATVPLSDHDLLAHICWSCLRILQRAWTLMVSCRALGLQCYCNAMADVWRQAAHNPTGAAAQKINALVLRRVSPIDNKVLIMISKCLRLWPACSDGFAGKHWDPEHAQHINTGSVTRCEGGRMPCRADSRLLYQVASSPINPAAP